MNKAQKLSDAEIIASVPDHCGCLKLPGQVGKHGWHWWIVTRNYLETVQKMLWRLDNPLRPYTEFQYDPDDERFLGECRAAERCPAYVAAAARRAPEASDHQGKQKAFRS